MTKLNNASVETVIAASEYAYADVAGMLGLSDTSRGSVRVEAKRLRDVNADFLAACKGPTLDLPDFLEWIAGRLVDVHGENPNVDFVLSLHKRASDFRAAIAKATGKESA